MGQLMVTSWLAAHRSHIPPAAWHRRRVSWTPEVSAAGWERCLRSRDAALPGLPATCYMIAETCVGMMVGIAAGAVAANDPRGTSGEVGSLYVHPDFHRHGVGRRLLQQIAARLHLMGVETSHIGVLAANVEGCRLYERLGGQFHGRQRLFDEDGDLLPEPIYTWPDITTLLAGV